MAIKPMLDDLELQLVQQIEANEQQVRAQHAVPALEGDFLQPLGRRAERITLNGILTEDDDQAVGEKLKGLREKFRAAQPVPFAADIATATKIDTVLIEEMSVRELAGKPERFEYAFALREYIPAPPPEEEEPPPPPEPLVTTLIVEVIVEGQPNFDFSKVTVTVDGHKEDGSPHKVTLGQPAGNIWTEEGFPPGSYTAEAVVTDPPPMSGSRPVQVLEGQKTQVTIILRPGSTRVIARAFVVHFRFDKAFIEPCMRKVLNEVAAYARGHEQEKMLIVGHTDKSGSDDYNYSLSDRRARSVFAYLNFGNDRAGSLREWNEMRRPSTHSLPSLRDDWGVRQYQYMLEDLGFLPGNVDGDHRDQTDAAVQAFRAAKGLPPGTTVDDAVWEALIEDYHGQEPQAVKPDRLLQNANDTGCNGGPLKWLSCGEEMPLPTTPPSPCNPNPGTAWRPNRRTEILFVTETTLPCPVPEPITFRLDPPGPVGTTWCLGPGNPARRSCFLTRDANDTTRWLVQPMEPGTITVTGSIRRPDGTGLANTSFVLIAPDGEFMNGEHLCGPARGTPNFGVTDANGNFDFSARSPTPVGMYTMEIKLPRGNHVAHLATQPPSTGRGSIVCTRLDTNNSAFDVIVFDGAPVPSVVNPSITPARNFVIVKKPHINPARIQITLRADSPFAGAGTLDRSGNAAAVRLFTADTGGTEIAFDGFDNVFTSAALVAGVTLFAEAGPAPSAAVDDYTLTLTLNPIGTGTTVGAPATAALTAVLFTLDIFLSRPAPAAPPPAMSEADKINIGRHVQFRDPSFTHERTMITVHQPVPNIPVTLELLPQNGRLQAFTQEVPAGGQAAIANPQVFAPNSIPAAGSSFFVEGTGASVSTAARDTGYLLRVQGIVAEVDRVAITVYSLAATTNIAPFDATIGRVQIEGVLNSRRASFDISDLYGNQNISLFRVRIDIAGIVGDTVQARLTGRRADRTDINSIVITLTRTSGNRFVSLPILAIPAAFPRADITFRVPQDIEVIQCTAGGRLRIEPTGTLAQMGATETRVRGRIVSLSLNIVSTSGVAEPEVNDAVAGANRIWAQAGIELRRAGAINNVADPGGLDVIEPLPANFSDNLGTERRTLFGLNPTAGNIDVYYVRNITGANGEGFGTHDLNAPMAAFGNDLVIRQGLVAQNTLAHELGHILINLPRTVNGGGDEHRLFTVGVGGALTSGAAAPATNIMHSVGILGRNELTSDQCLQAQTHPFVTFVE